MINLVKVDMNEQGFSRVETNRLQVFGLYCKSFHEMRLFSGGNFPFSLDFFALIEEELKGIKFRGQRTVSRRTRGPVF